MAGFKFRLEPILKLRKMRQEQQERVVGKRVGELIRAQDELRAVEGQIERQYADIRRIALTGMVRIEDMISNRRHLNYLHEVRHRQHEALDEAQRHADQAKQDLAETLDIAGDFIENDGHCGFRLSIPPENVTHDARALEFSHPDLFSLLERDD